MNGLRLQLASFRKLGPKLLTNRRFATSTTKLLLARALHQVRVPSSGAAGGIAQVSIRITDQCNLRCHTCGQWGDNGFLRGIPPKALGRNEVSADRYIELLRDLATHGHAPGVYLWGGEPMLYRGTVDILEAAAELGMPASFVTNGAKVANNAPRLVDAPLFLIQVSIDGANAEVHDACRPGAGGRSNNFATVVEALEAVRTARDERRKRLPLIAALCTINHLNQERLIEIHERFRDKVDLFVFYLAWWIDESSVVRHSEDFERRFGFAPQTHKGWIGGWRPTDLPCYQGS